MTRTRDVFGVQLPVWQDGLAATVPALIQEMATS
jgi:dTDP-4-dehydrorhamnose reductase